MQIGTHLKFVLAIGFLFSVLACSGQSRSNRAIRICFSTTVQTCLVSGKTCVKFQTLKSPRLSCIGQGAIHSEKTASILRTPGK